jgi:hypothetical protein
MQLQTIAETLLFDGGQYHSQDFSMALLPVLQLLERRIGMLTLNYTILEGIKGV